MSFRLLTGKKRFREKEKGDKKYLMEYLREFVVDIYYHGRIFC